MPISVFTTIDDPSAIRGTFADGINAAGQLVDGTVELLARRLLDGKCHPR